MQTLATNWTADPRVPAILQSIRHNSPSVTYSAHGLWSEYRNCALVADQREYDRSDERVAELRRIVCEHFAALDPIEAEQGTESYMAAARYWTATNPSADAVIDSAVVALKVAA